MKTPRVAAVFWVGLFLLAGALGVLKSLGLVRTPWESQKEQASYTSLVESKRLALLQSGQIEMKVLFPFDFIPPGEEINWSLLQWYYNNLPEDFEYYTQNPKEGPSPSQWQYASLYALGRRYGIDPVGRGNSFVVLMAKAKAGFSLADGLGQGVIQESIEGERHLTLTLPRATITDLIIADSPVEGYPPLRISPGQWGEFIGELKPLIEGLAVKRGVVDLAEGAAALLLEELLGSSFETLTILFPDVQARYLPGSQEGVSPKGV